MNYENLANVVMVFHAALIVCVFASILISVRYKRFRPFEAGILLIAIIGWSLYSGCPLTYLENSLRIHAGHPLPIVETGFISFYLKKWLALSITDKQITHATYALIVIFFAISIKSINPFINFEIAKLRKSFKVSK